MKALTTKHRRGLRCGEAGYSCRPFLVSVLSLPDIYRDAEADIRGFEPDNGDQITRPQKQNSCQSQ